VGDVTLEPSFIIPTRVAADKDRFPPRRLLIDLVPGRGWTPLASLAPAPWNQSSHQRFLALVSGERRGLWPGLLRMLLWIASLGYRLGVSLRNLAYAHGWKRSVRVAVPVVSVGNLTVGGTGKTPCVEYVARFYRQCDVQVAILSRGYGSEGGGGLNDEGMVLAENLPDVPPYQGADRVALAQAAIEESESEVLVLVADDAFQHRRLARDLDLVLIDATAPWGYGHLLPRGLLREPLSSLRRASALVLTRCDQTTLAGIQSVRERIAKVAPGIPVAETEHSPQALVNGDSTESLDLLRQHPVAGFCGLGNPQAFQQTLLDLGGRLTGFLAFPDHHAYTREDVERLREWARTQPDDALMVTTQKDLVKLRLRELSGRPLWAVRIQLGFLAGQAELDHLLERVLVKGT
jgi:tetraacyldisaccharide 4'-kinase